MNNTKIGVLGAGSWGTALAIWLANKGFDVELWSAVETEIELLRTKREHVDRLPGVILPDNIYIGKVKSINLNNTEIEKVVEVNINDRLEKLDYLFIRSNHD